MALFVDRGCSVPGNELATARDAAQRLVGHLLHADRLTRVTFAKRAAFNSPDRG